MLNLFPGLKTKITVTASLVRSNGYFGTCLAVIRLGGLNFCLTVTVNLLEIRQNILSYMMGLEPGLRTSEVTWSECFF